MFNRSGYWSETKHDHSFMDKLTGMAKIAGIVGVGIATAPHWSKLAGRVGSTIAEKFPTRLRSDSFTDAIQDVFGEEINSTFFDFPEQMQRAIATAITRDRKISKFTLDLGRHVDRSKTVNYEQIRDNLSDLLTAVGKVGSLADHEVDKVILNPDAMRHFTREAHKRGIIFQDTFYRDQRRIFEGIVAETSKFGDPTRADIVDYLDKNKEAVFGAFQELQKFQNRKVNFSRRFAQYEHMEEIKFGQLRDENVANKVEDYLTTLGVSKPTVNGQPTNIVNAILERADSLRESAERGLYLSNTENFGAKPSDFAAKVKEAMDATTTGLAIDKRTGGVVSIAALRKQRQNLLTNMMDELQIPLVPFKFNIPVKMFKFMSPSGEAIRNLGSLANEPELRRMGYGVGQHLSQGLAVGEKLLIINPRSKSIDFVNEEGKRFISYRRRESPQAAKLLDVRSQEAEHYWNNLSNFKGAEDNYSDRFMKPFFNNLPRFSEIGYHPEEGFVIGTKDSRLARAFGPTMKRVFGDGRGVDITKLHPTQLAEYITGLNSNDLSRINPEHLKQAFSHIITEAKNERVDISSFLKQAGRNIEEGSVAFDKDIPYYAHFIQMLRKADDPRELMNILGQGEITEAATAGSTRISRLDTSTLYRKASTPFYEIINTLRRDPGSLLEVTQGRAGIVEGLKSGVLGQTGISQSYEKLQEGLLSEVIRGMGVGELDLAAAKGGRNITAADEILKIPSFLETRDYDAIRTLGISDHLRTLGFFDEVGNIRHDELTRLVDQLAPRTAERQVVREELGKLGAAILNKKQLFDQSGDPFVKAKIMDDVREGINDLHVFRESDNALFNKQAAILYQMATDADIAEILRNRFTVGKAFHPLQPSLSPLNINNYLTTTSEAPSLMDWVENPAASIKSQIQRIFGAPQYLASLAHPDAALGPIAMSTQALLQMPQEIANMVGMGLTGQDRITTLRSTMSFYGKRIVPLVVGYEAYKNYNANMHAMGMPGLDDLAANLLANININMAKAKDALGITGLSQSLVNGMPGLDQYFSPRSEKEYRDYLMYGDEEVREGRGWLIGTRNPLMGGRVKYTRPNFFRRWTSHWTEADNVDISNPHYSFLPNLQNPFAPISLLLNPNWWEKKHISDRPYIPGGIGVGNPEQSRLADKDFITINSSRAYGPLAFGEIGAGYPVSMTGGGNPMSIPFKKGFSGGQGAGGLSHGNTGVAVSSPGVSPDVGMALWNNEQPNYGGHLIAQGDKIRLGLHKAIPLDAVDDGNSLGSLVRDFIQGARTQSGLYGAIMQRLPFYPDGDIAYQRQSSGAARSFSRMAWMGEYGEATGPMGEFIRRFVQPDSEGYDAYNPLPNNMPSWLPDKFKTGDPYMRTPGIGELQLPGDAFERTHPWITPLRIRGSNIGLTEEEQIQKWLNPLEPLGSEEAEDIVDFGSEVHKRVQRQLQQAGLLVGAEVSIYDREHNFSGTIDAIVRTPEGQGLEIQDIKTQGGKSWGKVPEKYKDQLTFYMAATGIYQSRLVFINRDNPQQIRYVPVEFDPNRWQNIINRSERARSVMRELVGEGKVSPFETYDIVSRIEILAKVAPDSPEFRDHVEHAMSGGLGGFEKQRVEAAIEEARKLKQEYSIYPKRYGFETETRKLRVEGINEDGTITTELGTISLAGIKFDQQAFAYEDPVNILGKFGVRIGKAIPVTLIKGQFNDEVMADMTMPAIVGNVNNSIGHSKYASMDEETKNPLGSQVVRGEPLLGKMWEWFAHTDNMFTNKFMRVRTALEQFERGEVFGTDRSKWDDPINNFVKPTINSFIKKDPLTAGVQSAIAASLFVRTNKATAKIPYLKSRVALAAGVIGASVALGRGIVERLTDTTWTPSNYREQAEFDEYWDTLTYLKYTAIAEQAKKKAKQKEGVDIDALAAGRTRETVGLGPWAVLAIDADRKAKRTMYGFEEAVGSLQDAIQALPRRQQQIAEEIVMTGSVEEKQRFYDLLPDAQRRVLGKFLGVDNIPDRPNLTKYFETHFLPEPTWEGWNRKVDMNDLEVRAAEHERVQIDKPNRIRVAKARATTNDIPVPRMDNPTAGNIRSQINALLNNAGFGHVDVNFDIRASDKSVVNVEMQLFEDQTRDLVREMRGDLDRA